MSGVREVATYDDPYLHRTFGGIVTVCGRSVHRFIGLPEDPCPFCFDVVDEPADDRPLADVWALCARLDKAHAAAVQPRNREARS